MAQTIWLLVYYPDVKQVSSTADKLPLHDFSLVVLFLILDVVYTAHPLQFLFRSKNSSSAPDPEPENSSSVRSSPIRWMTMSFKMSRSDLRCSYSFTSLFSWLQLEHTWVGFCWVQSIWHIFSITEDLKGSWSVSSFENTGRKQKLQVLVSKHSTKEKHSITKWFSSS